MRVCFWTSRGTCELFFHLPSWLQGILSPSSAVTIVFAICAFVPVDLGCAQQVDSDPASAIGSSGEDSTRQVQVDFNGQDPPAMLGPSQQLLLEQIEELIDSAEFEEAIVNLEKLLEAGDDQLVPRGQQQTAATISTQCYETTRSWASRRLAELLKAEPALRASYNQQRSERVELAFQRLLVSKDVDTAIDLALRDVASHRAGDIKTQLIDLLLERGWTLAAYQEIGRLCPDLRVEIADGGKETLPWSVVFARLDKDELARLPGWLAKRFADQQARTRLSVAVQRIVLAGRVSPDAIAIEDWLSWASVAQEVLGGSDEPNKDSFELIPPKLREKSDVGLVDSESVTFASGYDRAAKRNGRHRIASWPRWSHSLPIYMATTEQTPASKPRVGESATGTLPYHPLVSDGKVFVNTMTDIRAYEVESGEPWPDARSGKALYDSHISPSAFLPLGYPLLGTPRGTLTIDRNQLYARMGEPVTGWANRRRASDGGSVSYLIALDLDRQGSVLPGFPLHLRTPEFANAEFDGPPVLFEHLVIAPIVERDNVGLTRSVVAFYRDTGALAWQSPEIASGQPIGSERANLISHQLLTLAGGRLFYNTNLGAIACLDPTNGRLVWLSQYRRAVPSTDFPKPDRFRYRDLNPCLVHKGLVYCAPQDCPEIFSLDASQGDLVWSTDGEQVADAIHLLGVSDKHLVVSGDRLTWLDRRSGRIAARFPGGTTNAVLNALPKPRGMGRGMVSGGEVYWPVSGELLVFDLSLGAEKTPSRTFAVSPKLLHRVSLGAVGRQGGNLVGGENILLYATPTRVLAFD